MRRFFLLLTFLLWAAGAVLPDRFWPLLLWGGGLGLLLALRPAYPPGTPALTRRAGQVGAVLLALLGVLGAQVLWIQGARGPQIAGRVVRGPGGKVLLSNPRTLRQLLRARRGPILAADGSVLAESVVEPGRTFPVRRYAHPWGPLLGYDLPLLYGRAGLEAAGEPYLSEGETGPAWRRAWEGWLGRPRVGGRVITTLDPDLQALAQELLAGRKGAIVLLEPATGRIRALATSPTFDPNELVYDPNQGNLEAVRAAWEGLQKDPDRPLLHRAVQGLYPPGSAFKLVTAAAALEAGILTDLRDPLPCPETITVTGHPIVNAEGVRPKEEADLAYSLAWSCNTAFARLGLEVGAERLERTAEAFGILPPGFATRSDDLAELPLAVSRLYRTEGFLERPTGLADTAYGQGELLVTPLEMALVAAAIANAGVQMRPYLIERIEAPDGTVLARTSPQILRRPIGPETARVLREGMVAVVEAGWGRKAALPKVAVAGKTGTAEAPGGEPHAWFVGFAPARAPRYVVVVLVERGGYGSQTAAPLARRLLEAALAEE